MPEDIDLRICWAIPGSHIAAQASALIAGEWPDVPIVASLLKSSDTGVRALPHVRVLLRDGAVIGSVAILEDDMGSDGGVRNPWLGCLVVATPFRGLGLAPLLVVDTLAIFDSWASDGEIWLFCAPALVSFYVRFGFKSVDLTHFEGSRQVVMERI